MIQIQIDSECPACGNHDLLLITLASQHGVSPWYAHDGDSVVCASCGAQLCIHCDADMDNCEVGWDELTPHNATMGTLEEVRLGVLADYPKFGATHPYDKQLMWDGAGWQTKDPL